MANIGSLVADLQLNSAEFNRNLKTAGDRLGSFAATNNRKLASMERHWKSFSKSMGGFRKRYLNMGTAIGTLAGSTGLGLLINRSVDAADAIAKTADSIGVSTSVLQEYRYIAERSGVATEQLDKGLGAFTKRLGELRQGTGALNTLLSKYNEELKEQLIQSNSTEEALSLYFEALKKVSNQSDRAALSAAAFSRTAGIAMTNMIDNADSLRDRYERLGIEIDESMLRKAEATRDSIDDLSAVIKNSFTVAVLELSPAIGEAANNMAAWVSDNKEFISQDIPKHLQNTASALKDIYNLYKDIPDGLRGGAGVIGAALFGKKLAVFVAAVELLPTIANSMKGIKAVSEGRLTFFEYATANAEELSALLSEIENKTHKIPWGKKPLNAPVKTSGKEPPNTWTPEQSDTWTSEQLKLSWGIDTENALEGFEEVNQAKLDTLRDFNQEYADMNKSRFELERDRLNEQVEAYRQAGANKVELAEFHENKLSEITQAETQARMGFYESAAGQIAGTFQQIAQAGGRYSEEAFRMYQAFAIAQAYISGAMAYVKTLAEPALPFPGNVAMANIIAGMTAAQIGLIAAAEPPSYDEGGISHAKGIYQTGDIDEAHIPLKSGKVPVSLSGGGGGGNTVIIKMENPVFQDLATQRRVFTEIASKVAEQVAPAAVYRDYKNDGTMRRMVRSGG